MTPKPLWNKGSGRRSCGTMGLQTSAPGAVDAAPELADSYKEEPTMAQDTRALRRLTHGDEIPAGAPRRYVNAEGYIMCRWKLAPGEYVEALEHRLAVGLPESSVVVHHINGVKTDNHPDNLELTTASDHASHHWRAMDYDDLARLYQSGLSTPAIGRITGRNHAAVYRALVRHGVAMRRAS